MLLSKYKIYIVLTIAVYSAIAISILWLSYAYADDGQNKNISPSEKSSDQHLDFLVGRGFFKKLPNYPQLSAKLSNLFGIGGVLAAI